MAILTEDLFHLIASGGLSHPGSTIAHSMAWFQGCLYLGTSAPSTRSSADRARILRYSPVAGTWTTVFESPVLTLDPETRARASWLGSGGGGGLRRPGEGPDMMGREFGIRSMTVFQGRSDAAPCLYAGTMSIWGGLVLRSEDGESFAPVTEPGLGDDTVMSFRSMRVLGDRLFIAPAGTITAERIDRNLAPAARIFVSEDPAAGIWEESAPVAFDDPENQGIFAMATAHGHLYAGTGNPLRGFQLWRTDAAGEPPHVWTRVLTDGAGRFTHNLSTVTMTEFNGDLYVGTGIPGFGYDVDNDIGPCAAELLRVRPDGSWDLIVGEPRFTPDGLKVPFSMKGPGFDNPYNSAIWAMTTHAGTLFLGTHNWEANDRIMNGNGLPIRGGYELWATTDGETWKLVLDEGNGSPASCGIRTLMSTPAGLFVGTLNHARLLQVQAKLRGRGEDLKALSVGFDVLLGC